MVDELIGQRVSYPIRLNDHNRFSLASGDAAIRQSIYIIIHTVPGERVMRPDFGCEIHSLIFAPANYETAVLAERYVREALLRWEPRITLEAVEVDFGDTRRGEMFIHITYQMRGEYNARSLVYPYYLNPQEQQG
jgi:uncharacterized protein